MESRTHGGRGVEGRDAVSGEAAAMCAAVLGAGWERETCEQCCDRGQALHDFMVLLLSI